MKVLWICNLPSKDVYTYKNESPSYYGGWLTGMLNSLKDEQIQLIYCYPKIGEKKQDNFVYNNVHYYSFYTKKKYMLFNIDNDKYNRIKEMQLKNIIEIENPDIIHIFGTEFSHSNIASLLLKNRKNVCCSIQGLTSVIAQHYVSLLPKKIISKVNFSVIFRKTLKRQQIDMMKRGNREINTLRNCYNVIGRTDWDKACTFFINPERRYYKCNETLRDSFYDGKWDYFKCEKNSIFISQASSPIKGFNIVLKAVYYLKNIYPNIHVKVAGNNFIKNDNIKDYLKMSVYGNYIRKLIEQYGLSDKIDFLGELSEDDMKREYLNSNLFISASSIENSSNSIGEAMILGVPVISSHVGGVSSLLEDGHEGLLYAADEPIMLAYQIKRIFDDKDFAIYLSKNARKKAKITHCKSKNKNDLLDIYKDILKNNSYY